MRPTTPGENGAPPDAIDPAHIVAVRDFSPDTLNTIAAHLEVSTDFEHLVYREAELDAIWSITGFFLAQSPAAAPRDAVMRLHEGAHRAHDLVGERRPREAAHSCARFYDDAYQQLERMQRRGCDQLPNRDHQGAAVGRA